MKRIRLKLFIGLFLVLALMAIVTIRYAPRMIRDNGGPVSQSFWIDPATGNQYFVGMVDSAKTHETVRENAFWVDPATGNQYFVSVTESGQK
jgi:hypothetical protein